jgi:response regulator RpfG family c-di-GMP phosphodiesterase
MKPENSKVSILYVDDESSNLITFKANFRHEFDITVCASAQEGIEVLAKQEIHIIITDQRMPEMTGVEFLEKIMGEHPKPIRILLTGYTELQTVVEAVNKGKIYQYVTKPYNVEELKNIILAAHSEYEKNEKVLRDNEKYEFLLRQKLLR